MLDLGLLDEGAKPKTPSSESAELRELRRRTA